MNVHKDRARIHRAIDSTLSGLPEDPNLVLRIAAHTAQSRKGANMRNYRWAIIMALIVVLSLGTAAVASGVLRGTVDWDGNFTPDSAQPTSAPVMVSETESPPMDPWQRMADFESANPHADGQQMAYYDLSIRDTPFAWDILYRSAADMQQFENMLETAEGFVLPTSIPDGYVFNHGRVYYGCKPDAAFQLVETVDSPDGFRAETYVLDDADAIITGYDLTFLKQTDTYDAEDPETWDTISVFAFLSINVEESDLYIRDSLDVFPVHIPHMTKAVAVQEVRRNNLEMYVDLPHAISYRHSNFDKKVETMPQITFSVWSNATMEETIALFGGK